MNLNDRLKDIVSAAAVMPQERLADCAVDGHIPQAVVSPSDADALGKVLAFASREKLVVVPWGGGTCMSLGNRPSRVDIVVRTGNINKVTEHSASDFTMAVGAGATLASIEQYLARHQQMLPLDAPLPDRATVGGVIAANTTTPKRLAYNMPRDWVLGMKVVQADGSLTAFGGRVVKNVSGYDISRLYVGSLGTLGVIVETTLRLMPAPKAQETLVATYDDVQATMKAAKAATSQSFTPQSVEVVTGEAIKVLPAGMATNGTRAAVVVSIAGWPGAAKRMANEMSKLLSSARSVERLSGDNAEAVWRALTDLGWVRGDGTVLLLRASLQLSSLDEAVSNVAAQQTEGLRMGMVVGPGYGGFRVLLWGTPTSPDRVRGFALAVRGAVSKLGGYAFVENCQVEVKNGLDVWGAVPGGLDVMKRVKKELDPNNILNPGRFVEGI